MTGKKLTMTEHDPIQNTSLLPLEFSDGSDTFFSHTSVSTDMGCGHGQDKLGCDDDGVI